MPPYVRPAPPSLDSMKAQTSKLAAQLDKHAKHLGVTLHRPVAPGDLAGVLRGVNAERGARIAWSEEQQNAREEILLACQSIGNAIGVEQVAAQFGRESKAPDVLAQAATFIQAVREFLALLAATTQESRTDALRAMRENVASMARTGGLPVEPASGVMLRGPR